MRFSFIQLCKSFLLGFFFFQIILVQPSLAEQNKVITFGIVPQQPPQKIVKKWRPITNYISKQTGFKIVIKTAPDIPTFEKRCLKGQYDIAYMNPYHYVIFHQSPGYIAFAKQKDKKIKGILVAAKSSPYKTPVDLDGKKLAFPSPAAFAASILTRAYLTNNGINFTPSYVKSHDSVYLSVAKGLYSSGGGVVRTFNNMNKETRDKLRILYTTKGYTPHAFAAHPRLAPQHIDKITQALLSINDDSKEKQLLKVINFNGFSPAKDQDWNDVRALGINILQKLVVD